MRGLFWLHEPERHRSTGQLEDVTLDRGRGGEHIELVCGPSRDLHGVAGGGAEMPQLTEPPHAVAVDVVLAGGLGPSPRRSDGRGHRVDSHRWGPIR